MELISERIYIRKLQRQDMNPLLDLRIRNRHFHQSFEPLNPDAHYTLKGIEDIIEMVEHNWEKESAYGFGIFVNHGDKLIGRVNLSNIVRGAWESCTIGYWLDEQFCGRGLATEAVRLAVEFAFDHASLHRVQGAVMPHNLGSIRVLEKTGFRYEGFSEYYLKINGKWEHHHIYSITREYWIPYDPDWSGGYDEK